MRTRTQDEEAHVSWQDNMAFEMSKQSIEDEWASVEKNSRVTAATRDLYRDREYAIQPHTDAAGLQYEIGDFYHGIDCAHEWEIENPGPYLRCIKSSVDQPEIHYLGHWMEVTTSPAKWKWIRHFPENRRERASRTKVCIVDYKSDGLKKVTQICDVQSLGAAVQRPAANGGEAAIRMLIAEDLSRDVVEVLGSSYTVPPDFFRNHIDDYLFNNTRDPWAQVPKVTDVRKDHFNIPYFRVRYYVDEDAFAAAEIETGLWNCLRRIDSDRSRKRLQDGLLDRRDASVSLMRSKLSVWLQPAEMGQPVIAILLVDPTPLHGHALWGGPAYEPGELKQDIAATAHVETAAPARLSLFDRIVRAQCNMSTRDLEVALKCPKFLALPSIRHVMAEWLLCIQYMSTQLGKLEWEFERPYFGQESSDVDSLLKKGSPWNRNIRYYQEMLRGIAETLFEDDEHENPDSHPSIRGLQADIRKAERRIENVRQRLERLQDTAASVISIEDSRRATRHIQQNAGTARLTLLATIFLPLNFATSFLSMSSDFSVHNDTFRLFFIVSAAVLGVMLAWVAYMNFMRYLARA